MSSEVRMNFPLFEVKNMEIEINARFSVTPPKCKSYIPSAGQALSRGI